MKASEVQCVVANDNIQNARRRAAGSQLFVDTVKELLRQEPSRLEILGQFLGQRVADTSTHGDPRIGFLKFQTSQLFEQGDIFVA